MKNEVTYRTFDFDRNIHELLYNSKLWITEFQFFQIELAFIKLLFKSYPFKTKIPNLFENIQLFILELDGFEKDRNDIINKLNFNAVSLNNKIENNELALSNLNLIDEEKLAEEVFNFKKNYTHLKSRIYEYISGLIN